MAGLQDALINQIPRSLLEDFFYLPLPSRERTKEREKIFL
jgi:hypothetical protein